MKKLATLTCLALACGCVNAENLVFNSGFELGDAGTGFVKVLQLDTNPEQLYEGPVVDASTSASGAHSLRIPNRFAEKCELFFREFKLKPGTEYTFSASMKSSIQNLKVTAHVGSASTDQKLSRYERAKPFLVNKAWSRQSFTFKTAEPWPNDWHALRLEFCKAKDDPAGDLWLDDVQLLEGKETKYRPPLVLEAAATIDHSYYIVAGKGNEANASLKVYNGTERKETAKLQVSAVDDSSEKVLFTRDFEVSLKPGESAEIPFKLPIDRFGAYRLETRLLDAATAFASFPGFFVVAGKYESKAIDIGKTFCVGLNMDSANYQRPPRWGMIMKPGFRCDGRSTDAYLKLLSDMGCRFVREWGEAGTRWLHCEPEEGKFDFTVSDKVFSLYDRYGMTAMPVFGSDLTDDGLAGAPNWAGWLKAKSPMLEKSGDWGRPVRIPPMENWRSYIRNVVSHYKGKVGYYEILNEPNGWLAADKYIEFLKAANEEIKKADPNARTVGFVSTGDLGGNLEGFMGKCYKLGGLNYVDIVSFHPYNAPHLASARPADKQIEDCKNLLKTYAQGRQYPLWDDEMFYLRGTFGHYFESDQHQAYHTAWRFLTDLGEGVGQECFQSDVLVFKNLLTPHYASHYQSQESPSADFVAYNALARLFEGAKPGAKIRWGNDTICYVYEREGKPLAAFWNYGEIKDMKLKLDVDKASGVQLFDLFGNELPFPSDGLINLGPEPFYLAAKPVPSYNIFASEMSAGDFDKLLRDGKVETAQGLAVGSTARLVPKNGGWTVAVPFLNCSNRDLSGKLEVQGEGVASSERVSFSLPAKGKLSLQVPVKLGAEKLGKVSAKFEMDGKTWSYALTVPPKGKVLRPGESVQLGNASLKAESDGKTLKLSFAVKDSTPSGAVAGRNPWEQDCVELFFDPAPSEIPIRHAETYTDRITRLFILPYAPEGRQLVKWSDKLKLDGLKSNVVKKDNGYLVELEMPLTSLESECVGFEAQIDDADTVKRRDASAWSSNGEACKNRLSFGFLELK